MQMPYFVFVYKLNTKIRWVLKSEGQLTYPEISLKKSLQNLPYILYNRKYFTEIIILKILESLGANSHCISVLTI